MAESTPTPESKPEQPAASAVEPKALSADESAKVLAALQKANAEAKQYRERLEAETKAKADAEQAKLAAEGKWKEAFEAERKRAEELAAKAAQVDPLAQELEAFKAAELAALPDDVKAIAADLPPSKAIALARKWQAANAAPKAAPAVNGGAPAPSKAPVSFNGLTEQQIRDQFRSNPDALAKAKALVFGAQRDPFAP